DLLDLVDLARRDQGGGLAVGRTHLDAAAVVLHTAVDEGVEVLRQRAHRGQREHADEDAADREEAAELVARDVADDFHGGAMRILRAGVCVLKGPSGAAGWGGWKFSPP